MLQVGRSLFREASLRDNQSLFSESLRFFEAAVEQTPDSAEAVACAGYAKHRLGDDEGSIASLRKALQLDSDHSEARIYLANLLYDRGEFEGALYHFERTQPEDHWDELGIWRLIELKRAVYKLDENDAELKPWDERPGDALHVRGIMRTLQAHGRRIPADVSVIGFDGISLGAYVTPALTSIVQPRYDAGRMAFQLLLERMHDGYVGPQRSIQLETQLERRDSTGTPPR